MSQPHTQERLSQIAIGQRLQQQLRDGNLTVVVSQDALNIQPNEPGGQDLDKVTALQNLAARRGVNVILLGSQSREQLRQTLRDANHGSSSPFFGDSLAYSHGGNRGQLFVIGADGAEPDPALGPTFTQRASTTEASREQCLHDIARTFHTPVMLVGSAADLAGFKTLSERDTGVVVGDEISVELDESGMLVDPKRVLKFLGNPTEVLSTLKFLGLPDREPSDLILLSHRLPWTPLPEGGWKKETGGLVTAIDTSGVRPQRWFGFSNTDASWEHQVGDTHFHAALLDDSVFKGYYEGFSNAIIWPLFHDEEGRVAWDDADQQFEDYKTANRVLADAAVSQAKKGAKVWVQDYQLMLAPGLLKKKRPDLTVGFYLHIPFPATEKFLKLEQGEELVKGLLGGDLIEFQTPTHYDKFTQVLQALIDRAEREGRQFTVNGEPVQLGDDGAIRVGRRTVGANPRPISIDAHRYAGWAANPEVERQAAEIREPLGDRTIAAIFGRDDYSKGYLETGLALEYAYDTGLIDPRELMLYASIDKGNRSNIAAYRENSAACQQTFARVNNKHSYPMLDSAGKQMLNPISGKPLMNLAIHDHYEKVAPEMMPRVYRAANIVIVPSLADGQNLMAKEAVMSWLDGIGVLIISKDAGAAEELGPLGAIVIDPRDPVQFAAAIREAFDMPIEEQIRRNRAMQRHIMTHDVGRWASGSLEKIELTAAQQTAVAPRLGGGGSRSMHRLIGRDGEPFMNRWTGSRASRSSGLRGR